MALPKPQLTDPVQVVAFGFGSGLSPKAPGTVGSAAALLLYPLIAMLSPLVYALVVIAACVLGIWICGHASKRLKVHDHPGIVWDEFAGMWITLWAVPAEPLWVIAGFVVFRVLDITKPWPIGWLDRNTDGGLGIMIDDVVAGIIACAVLHLALLGTVV
ncbi:MAG: phosphatidylglycerophosphatase A [Pseudomonadota bacterium]